MVYTCASWTTMLILGHRNDLDAVRAWGNTLLVEYGVHILGKPNQTCDPDTPQKVSILRFCTSLDTQQMLVSGSSPSPAANSFFSKVILLFA